MTPTLSQLRQLNPKHERWKYVYANYRLAYIGGNEFLAAAGTEATYRYDSALTASQAQTLGGVTYNTPRRRFLRQFEGEPTAVYNALWDRAEYINYLSPAINYFLSLLFSIPPIIRPREGEDTPDWFEPFMRNANGSGKGLFEVARELMLEAQLCQRSGWMIGRPESVGEQGKDDESLILSLYKAEEILDWQHNDCGELEWVTLCKEKLVRDFPDVRRRIQTYTLLNRDEWKTWEVTQDEQGQDALTPIGESRHGLGNVPFVMMELPHGLWITDRLYAWQVGLFNQWTRLKNAMTLGCVLQPAMTTNEPGNAAAQRIIGEGIMLTLRAGDATGGGKEDFGWKSPDVSPLKFIWDFFKEAVAEGYRIIQQMSGAVDAKSVASIARSGASKAEDRRSTEVITKGLGAIMATALVQTCDLISEIKGDKSKHTLDGFDNFTQSEPMDEATFLMLGTTAGIESTTFKKRLQQKLARTFLDKEDESTRETIDDEIDASADAAQQAQEEMDAAKLDAVKNAAEEGMKPGVMGQDQDPAQGGNPFAKGPAPSAGKVPPPSPGAKKPPFPPKKAA